MLTLVITYFLKFSCSRAYKLEFHCDFKKFLLGLLGWHWLVELCDLGAQFYNTVILIYILLLYLSTFYVCFDHLNIFILWNDIVIFY